MLEKVEELANRLVTKRSLRLRVADGLIEGVFWWRVAKVAESWGTRLFVSLNDDGDGYLEVING